MGPRDTWAPQLYGLEILHNNLILNMLPRFSRGERVHTSCLEILQRQLLVALL